MIYLGALVLLFLNAFWRVDTLTGRIIQDWGLQNFDTLWSSSVYRTITFRTVRIAALVTVADVILVVPTRLLRSPDRDPPGQARCSS